jgi:hypothetical protein
LHFGNGDQATEPPPLATKTADFLAV